MALNTSQQEDQGSMVRDYGDLGISKQMTKEDAPRFRDDPLTQRGVLFGEETVRLQANVGPGTVLRGSLAARAKATPFNLQLEDANCFQVNTGFSASIQDIIYAVAGAGTPNYIDGFQVYGEFPLRDRQASHNVAPTPTGIARDSEYVWLAEGTALYRLPLDLSSVTTISPSSTTISGINGLAHDGNDLYTVYNNSGTYELLKIEVSGTNYTWSVAATLDNAATMCAMYDGKRFWTYDSGNNLIRIFNEDGSLFRNIAFQEANFRGAFIFNGLPHIAVQEESTKVISIKPIRV